MEEIKNSSTEREQRDQREQREQIEAQLLQIVDTENKSWTTVYRLLSKVKNDGLYAPDFKSFTAWIRSFSKKAKTHESRLWQYLNAGKYYEEYSENAAKRGIEVPKLEEAQISPDNVDLIKKISRNNPEKGSADYLMERTLAKEVGRTELTQAWALVKAECEKNGISPIKKSRHDITPETKTEQNLEAENTTGETRNLTAADIVLALSKSSSWFNHLQAENKKQRCREQKYKILTEVAVRTGGTTRSARQIDALAVENYSVQYPDELKLRGVEIKVAKNDLLGDKKMSEYTDFVDYFYIAVPENLVEDARAVCLPEWGILAISFSSNTSYSIRVVQEAKQLDAVMRAKTLAQALFNII